MSSRADTRSAMTLKQLGAMVTRTLQTPQLHDVWVVAELSDVRVSGGHCYMELIEKNSVTGAAEARMRGIIWSSAYLRLDAMFSAATGRRLATGLKVMVRGSVNFHASFGMSFVISDIDPSYTMGEAERLRREILARLEREGVLKLNRELEWTAAPLRVAVISAAGAAGYGDFLHQLYGNGRRLRFVTRLFPAVLQGERTASSVIASLDEIGAQADDWDCVVIIRGGGATSELAAFDNYELANNVAQFPLPVIVGIGHERDVTVLDYVANMRVKTPTAAAEWLIGRCGAQLDLLASLGADISAVASERISGCLTQIAYLEGQLPIAPAAALQRSSARLDRLGATLSGLGGARLAPARGRLDSLAQAVEMTSLNAVCRAAQRLDAQQSLAEALSPRATLRRGYSLTMVDGHAVRSAAQLTPRTRFVIMLADGTIKAVAE